jgi:O-antigen ligase
MGQPKDSLARNNRSMMVRGEGKHRGAVFVFVSVIVGLVLAIFMMISPAAGIIALSSGIVLAFTIFVRKTDYLIYAWFFLTSFIMLIMRNLLPEYYPFIGRGIFWGLLGCMILAWATDNVLRRNQFMPFDNVPLTAIILIFMLWCTVSLFTSIDVFYSFKKWSHLVIALIASYMFYDFFSRDQYNIKRMLNVVSLITICVSFVVIAVAIRCLISGIPIYKEINLWFVNPNALGSFLFVCSPLLITSGFDFRPIKQFKFLFVSLMLLALFFSFHRTSWVALLVSMTYLLWKGRAKMSLAAASILVLFVVGLTFPLWGGNFYHYIAGEQYTGRKELWQASWNTACDYPLLGTGLGNSVGIIDKYIDTPWLKLQETHSVYLQNAVEMGFMSTVLLLVFYITFLYYSESIEKNMKNHYLRLAARGTTATFFGLFVHGIFGNFGILTAFDAMEFSVLMPYILISLPFACKRLEEREGLVT